MGLYPIWDQNALHYHRLAEITPDNYDMVIPTNCSCVVNCVNS